MVKKFFLFAMIVCFLGACSNSSNVSSSEPDPIQNAADSTKESHEGMILVKGSERAAIIGTNKKGAKETETPELRAILDYDYFMDSALVRCKDFKSVMEGTKLAQSLKCNNNEPITDITFFDAVLFANKKSKQAKLDTVYDYANTTFDNEGHCTNLSGFLFYAERKGFRLPTEAEWIKGASGSYDLHFPNNLREWSNDYLGKLKDTTIVNFAGAKNANDLDERVIKNFDTETDSSKPSLFSRGDVYTVTSASHADYIGFRLVIGTIPNATWMNNDGITSSSPISILAKAVDLWDFSKTSYMKMIFRNDLTGNLAFIDYNENGSSINEIVDTISAYHPDISPDGNWVAFCTGLEGVSNQSSLYVRHIDSIGSNLVKLNVESAAIPRWNVLENGDTVITYVTNPGNNKDETTFKSYSTWQVTFANGKFGKPQKLFDGAYHGGISNGLAISGARLLRARVHDKDTIWYNNEQACNASLSKDNSRRTAFLDFGGKTGQTFVGKKYSTHQYILIADSTGKLTSYVQAPTGYTFDHSEWTVGETNNNIVATLVNSNGAHKRISLINLTSQNITDLIEGDEVWHPCFWTKPQMNVSSSSSNAGEDSNLSSSSGFALDPDSAGIYYKPGASYKAINMRIKMELLWKYKDTSNTVILGSSRSKNSIIPNNFSEPFHAINLGNSGFTLNETSFLYFNYVMPHVKKIRYLVVSLDIDLWWIKPTSNNNFFYSEYKEFPGYIYDQNHQFWKDGLPDNMYQLTYESIGGSTYAKKFRDTRGYEQYNDVAGWSENPTIGHDSTWMEKDPSLYENSFKMFKDIVESCNKNQIYIIGIIFPQSPGYKNTGSFGYGGPQRSKAISVLNDLNDLSKKYPYFILMDENKMGDHDYSDEMARDEEHLAHLGAIQITHRLDSLMQTLNINGEDNP
ncbi:MAG: TIGR02171 family protein [Fibrobacter sp.]|nr:TIGR02171 family protein [Fibrobacter sp.]